MILIRTRSSARSDRGAAMESVRSADGTTIALERSGDGPALVVVTGAFCARSTPAGLAAALDPSFTVWRYDRRGRGDSGDTPPYAVEREIDDLAALIESVGGQAYVCGHSSGSVLALAAAGAGLAISRLAVFEPPFRLPDGPQLPPDYQEHVTSLVAAARFGEVVEYFMTSAVGLPAEAVGQMRKSPAWPGLEALAPTLVYDGLLLLDPSLPAGLLAGITVPALVLDSTGSAPWLRNAAQATARALPNARHRSLDGTFHQLPPKVLAPALAAFFTP